MLQRRADQRRRRARARRATRGCSARARGWSPSTHVSNALGTHQPGRAHHRAGARARRAGAGRRRPGGAAPAGRRAGARLRFLRLLRPQAVRPDRHRRALRQGGAARSDAALPGRRRHDPLGHLREDRPTTSCPTSSRPARRTSPAPSGWAPRSTTSTAIGLDAIAAHEHELLAYATERLARDPGPAPHRHGAREGEHPVVRARRRAPARHRHDPRPRGRRGPRRPPLRAAGDGALRRRRHRARLVRALQHARRHRCAGRRASIRCGRSFDDRRPARALPGASSSTTPQPRNFGGLPGREPHGRGLQPAVRRPGHRLPEVEDGHHQGRGLRGRRLRDLDGLRLADDRGSEGQEDRRSRARLRAVPSDGHRPPTRHRTRRSASSRCSPACASSRCASSARPWRGTRCAPR